jgi:starch synthase
MKAGLVYSDAISTVSPSYAEEITTAYYRERLDGLIRARKDSLYGVLNGIDVAEYDPEHDPQIYKPFSLSKLEGKAENKRRLQQDLGLTVDAAVPLIAMVGRLTNQKGLDLMSEKVPLAVRGMGDARYTNLFSWAEGQYRGQLAARFAMDTALAHKLYAGADFFLMPSLFEPCGLSQLIAMRYGTIPIVRETGGLRDTVLSYNEFTKDGNGFSFLNYNAHDMLAVIRRALHYYENDKAVLKSLQKRGMEGDYSWAHSARDYVAIYEKLTSTKRLPPGHRAKTTGRPLPRGGGGPASIR